MREEYIDFQARVKPVDVLRQPFAVGLIFFSGEVSNLSW